MNKVLLAGFALALLTACNWVQLTAAGQAVRLTTANVVSECNRVGRARVNSMSKVTFVERGAEKLQNELITLARNEAADLGGNYIVAESTIDQGQQTFGVFYCP